MRIFLWNVRDAWTTAFVRGRHDYFIATETGCTAVPSRERATVHPIGPDEAARLPFDVVVLQRPEELSCLGEQWLGRRPGVDLPAVYVEHEAPHGDVNDMRHVAADRRDLALVHVTHFNCLFWDAGTTPTRVIEHGIVDPGYRYTGEIAAAAVVIDEPGQRRVTGTDLLAGLTQTIPIDVFGVDAARSGGLGRVAYDELQSEIACRRVYLHLVRWTSIGMALIEAMHLGMPVVALATTEVPAAVPATAGVVSNRLDVIEAALRRFLDDPPAARRAGIAARTAALARFGLDRFLANWDRTLHDLAAAWRCRSNRPAMAPARWRRPGGVTHRARWARTLPPSHGLRVATVQRDHFRSGDA